MKKLSDEQREYLLKESEYLRDAYKESVREISILERYSVVIAGVIWSWCAKNLNNGEISTGLKYLIWVPVIAQFLFGFRALGVYQNMIEIKSHLARMEEKIQLPVPLGWGKNFKPSHLLTITGFAFWGALSLSTIGIAVYIMWIY